MTLAIITSNDSLFDELKYRYQHTQKGQYVSYQERLFLVTDDSGLKFVEVDPASPERRDPSHRWGKYEYLGDPDERNNR